MAPVLTVKGVILQGLSSSMKCIHRTSYITSFILLCYEQKSLGRIASHDNAIIHSLVSTKTGFKPWHWRYTLY